LKGREYIEEENITQKNEECFQETNIFKKQIFSRSKNRYSTSSFHQKSAPVHVM